MKSSSLDLFFFRFSQTVNDHGLKRFSCSSSPSFLRLVTSLFSTLVIFDGLLGLEAWSKLVGFAFEGSLRGFSII